MGTGRLSLKNCISHIYRYRSATRKERFFFHVLVNEFVCAKPSPREVCDDSRSEGGSPFPGWNARTCRMASSLWCKPVCAACLPKSVNVSAGEMLAANMFVFEHTLNPPEIYFHGCRCSHKVVAVVPVQIHAYTNAWVYENACSHTAFAVMSFGECLSRFD